MEKNMILSSSRGSEENDLQNTLTELKSWLMAPFRWLKHYYSGVMDRELSNRQIRLLVQVQVLFFLTVFSTGVPVVLHALLFLWLLYTVVRCRMEFRE
ncbi:MAG: hypothetical protein ACOYJF_04620 [Prevotella sp.]|jgi:hypothetical protein